MSQLPDEREAMEKRLSESDLETPSMTRGGNGMAKFKTAIHKRVSPDKFNGKNWSYKTELREVEVMAVAAGFAMVRIKGYAPYLCPVKEIQENT